LKSVARDKEEKIMYQMYAQVELAQTEQTVGTGWLPPMPDFRDFTDRQEDIVPMIRKLGFSATAKKEEALPMSVDLRKWCSSVENQGSIGSCTAHACVGVVEYYECRAFGKFIDGSRLFVYKTTRNLIKARGDTGAWLRSTMGALALCGVPPEKYWPYTDKTPDFDKEPTSFVYAVADNYEAMKYFCHDPMNDQLKPVDVLQSVKKYLAAGVPSVFGFFGFPSFEKAEAKGDIPYPCPGEKSQWGHAIAAVGYDDKKKIKNMKCNKSTTGALLIRNSWGKEWGEKGYGWLPYEYVLNKLAVDFWSLLSMEMVDTKQFGLDT
jgi:C1A family cysteine protease